MTILAAPILALIVYVAIASYMLKNAERQARQTCAVFQEAMTTAEFVAALKKSGYTTIFSDPSFVHVSFRSS